MFFTRQKWILFVLILAVAILVNIASTTLFFRIDITKNKSYSLSKASRESVATLQEPFTIKAFLSKNLPAPYNNTEQVLRDLLEEYAIAGNKFFSYSIISMPSKEEIDSGKGVEKEDEARKYRIFPIQIQNIEQDEVVLQTAYMGVVFVHGDIIETIPAVTSTESLEYEITKLITKMGNKISALLSLREDIAVTLYLTENLNQLGSSIGALPRDVEAAVNDLNDQYYGRLEFSSIDPIASGTPKSELDNYNIQPLTLRKRTNTGEETETAYASLVIAYGEKHYAQGLLTRGLFGTQVPDPESIKDTIEEVAESVIGINEEIGYISDYGTPSLSGEEPQGVITPVMPDMQNFNDLVSEEYTLREIALKETRIPEGIRSVVISGPRERFSDYDLFKIDQYLMKGGRLVLFLDAISLYMPQSSQFGQAQEPQLIPRDTGIEDLIAHYGVRLKPAYVLDEESFTQRQRSASGGIVETPVYYAPLIAKESINSELKFLNNIPQLVTLYQSPLEETGRPSGTLTIQPVFSSSKDAWEMEEGTNLAYPMLIQPPPDDMQTSMVLGYILDGEFTSYFADKAVPEPPPAEDTEDQEEPGEDASIPEDQLRVEDELIEGGTGRILVIGTSAILGSNVLDREGQTGNSLFILNLLDYMNDREDYAIMRTKGVSFSPLEDLPPQVRSFVKSFNIAGLAVLVVIAGILVWVARISKKRRIQAMFRQGQQLGDGSQDAGVDNEK